MYLGKITLQMTYYMVKCLRCQQRRMRLAGHCIRHPEEMANKLVLWEPSYGKRNRGRRSLTFIDTLLEDTGMENKQELKSIMEDRDDWKQRVRNVGRPSGRRK